MTAADRIRARIAELQGIRERYLAYQQDRVNERDHHGAWDVAVNLSETECEISGIEFALKAIEEEARLRDVVEMERGRAIEGAACSSFGEDATHLYRRKGKKR